MIRKSKKDSYYSENTIKHYGYKPTLLSHLRPVQVGDLFAFIAGDIYYLLRFYRNDGTFNIPQEFADCPNTWCQCLDAMIWSFQQIRKNYEHDPYYHFWAEVQEAVKTGQLSPIYAGPTRTKPFPPYWQNLSDKYLAQSDAYLERIQHGTELFGKYFQYLW